MQYTQKSVEKSVVRSSLVARGLENVKKYAWARTARRTIDLFEQLAGK